MAALAGEDGADPAADQYGVIGHPVAHSWSPFIHGMFARELHQNLRYQRFDVPPEAFRAEVERLCAAGVRGFSVTIPHKQAAAELVHERTPRAQRAQAVNTIARRGESLLGDNTDGVGLLRDLERNHGVALPGRRVLLLGAGGAARGVLAPLLERAPRELVIANRNPERAVALAAEFADLGPVRGCGFADLEGPPFDLVINATAASLQGEMPALPPGLVGTATLCYDMAYGAGPTPFTRWGDTLGAGQSVKGWGMLVEQAAAQFELWRGLRPDTAPVLAALAQYR